MIAVISAQDVAMDSDDSELLMKRKIDGTFIGDRVANKQRGEESGQEASV